MLAQSFDFDDQHRRGVARKTHRRAALDRFDGGMIHDFQCGRNDSCRGDIDDGFGGAVHVVENREQRAHGFARLHQLDGDFRDDAHGAFGADENAAEIVARRVRHFAAKPDDCTVVEHDFDAEHMVGRDAVGERVRPAGIVRDVAADGASGLAAWVGRVEKAVFGDGFA